MPFVKDGESYDDYHTRLKSKSEVHRFELFSLDCTIACFILPRLKYMRKEFAFNLKGFKKLKKNNPDNENYKASYKKYKKMVKDLDKAIFAFDYVSSGKYFSDNSAKTHRKMQKGLKAFIRQYGGLWT